MKERSFARPVNRRSTGVSGSLPMTLGETLGFSDTRRLVVTLLFLGLLILVFFLQLWTSLKVLDLGYELAAGKTLTRSLQQENRELRVELATLTSPERLEILAKDRLGMRAPRTGEVIFLP